MRLKIVEIREDDEGDLWFLVEKYYTPRDKRAVGEDWWLHLSDEYSYWKREDGPVNGKQYRLVEVHDGPQHEMDDCKSCQVMSCEHCGSTDIDASCTGPKKETEK